MGFTRSLNIALGALVTRDGINFIKRGKEKIAIMLLWKIIQSYAICILELTKVTIALPHVSKAQKKRAENTQSLLAKQALSNRVFKFY